MDALCQSLIELIQSWKPLGVEAHHYHSAEARRSREMSDQLRSVLDKHKVGRWS